MAPTKAAKTKVTYMLHNKDDYTELGKYVSTTPRGAALKATSAGHTTILLRETGTKIIREYAGSIETLDEPVVIERKGAGKPIVYSKRPKVVYVRKFVMTDPPPATQAGHKADEDVKPEEATTDA